MRESHFTPESYNRRVAEWAAGEASYATFPTRTADELATRFIGDNERTAMLLLEKSSAYHVDVADWAQRLAADPTFVGDAPDPQYDPQEFDNPRTAKRYDDAVIALGIALIDYRLTGEEGHAAGFPLSKAEIPPLSAAIARYCNSIANVYAGELQRLKLGLAD